MIEIRHCKHCGTIIEGTNRKYCAICSPIVDKIKNRKRSERYRRKHGSENVKQWVKEHIEQRRLIARNHYHRHPDKHKQNLINWRKKNPDKVKEQNKRARKNTKRREMKNLYMIEGKHKPLKIKVTCSKCLHQWATRAKRPQCVCGYSFPMAHYEHLIDNLPTKPCKCCGREVPFYGKGAPREYCDCCFPQIQALKRVLNQNRAKKRNPKYQEEYYRNTHEVLAAMTCRNCGDIILYKNIGQIPQLCGYCYSFQRSRPMPFWEPKDTKLFIKIEKKRVGLNNGKKWKQEEIQDLFYRWEKMQYPPATSREEIDTNDNML